MPSWSRVLTRTLVTLASLGALHATAQYTPLISGGVGFLTGTNGGNTSYTPTIVPVLAAPIGHRVLIESRANLLETFFPRTGIGYDTSHFVAVSYLQADVLATSHLTVVGGYFLLPFGTYNERLAPIWISNFQDAPLITSLGAMSGGSGLGGMLRGNVIAKPKFNVDYSGYFSARSANEQFRATRSAGGRVNLYIPQARLEIGFSVNRLLQTTTQTSFYGVHAWWQPAKVPLRVLSQYTHAAHSQGFWVETDYRLSRFHGPESAIGRLELVFRWQQTFRNIAGGDNLPAQDTQRTDFGLDYHLPHEVRINTSYARQFSSTGNKNVWETGLVYRFLFPTWKGK